MVDTSYPSGAHTNDYVLTADEGGIYTLIATAVRPWEGGRSSPMGGGGRHSGKGEGCEEKSTRRMRQK